MTKKITAISKSKTQDILAQFFKLLKEFPTETIDSIFRRLELSSAPRFYCSVEQAHRMVALLVKKKELPLVNKNSRRMYQDIYTLFLKEAASRGVPPINASRRQANVALITEDFLNTPAPSFYLDVESIKGQVYRNLRAKNEN